MGTEDVSGGLAARWWTGTGQRRGYEIERPDEAFRLDLYAYGASRTLSRATLSEDSDGDAALSLFIPDARLLNAEEWLLRLYFRQIEGDDSAARALPEVQRLLVDLLPDVDRIEVGPPRTAPGDLGHGDEGRLRFYTPYGEVGLRRLSLGYQTLIAWTVDLAWRLWAKHPEADNPLHAPAVVLVDEIDLHLHLHPSWQRSIHERLRRWFPNVQFIVTAHSPLVVQASLEANIAVLRRDGDQVIIDNDPDVVAGWRVDQVLTSELFGLDSARPPQVEALLERKRALLEGGVLSEAARQELAAIDGELDALPIGESRQAQEDSELIRGVAELLRARGHG